jgi:4-carboxymuconolactone decarboxylase
MHLKTQLLLILLGIALPVVAPIRMAGQTLAGDLIVPDRPGHVRPVSLTKPRILPLPESQWTDVHRKLVAKHLADGRAGNAIKTLLNVPELVDGMMPMQNYITRDTSLSQRHREILILRTAWLLNNDSVWGEHASLARTLGMTTGELRRIAQGPNQRGWDPFEAVLLRLADELFRNTSVTDATWRALAASYDIDHLMDAVLTVTHFTTVSLLYNTLGIQPDAAVTDHMPTEIPYRVVVPAREPPLTVARVLPLEGSGLAIGRTFQRKRTQLLGSKDFYYRNQHSQLDPRYRELLILRTGWDCQSEYEWAQHVGKVGRAREMGLDPLKIAGGPTASGWDPFEVVLLKAADELYRDSMISDRTWNAMAARFDATMLINATISAANYRANAMALNALGVQLDAGDERMPALQRR